MPNAPRTHKPIRIHKPDHRPSPSARGYDWTWTKIRKAKLYRDPLCEECKRGGLVVPAVDIDHIDNDQSNNSDANLMSLCKPCHGRKTRLVDYPRG